MNPISEQRASQIAPDVRPHSVSACPVHFIWDGKGLGRPFVRAGFMGFMAAGVLHTAKLSFHAELLGSAAQLTLALSTTSYVLGQAFSAWVKRQK